VVGVDYKEYLLRGNETVYMSFIDWIAAMAKKKGRQKSHQTYKSYWKWLSEYYALHNKSTRCLVRTQVPLRRNRVRTSGNLQSPHSLVPNTNRLRMLSLD
jgi:hypothetical protein